MAARILYLGADDCLRIPVLKGAGHAIEICRCEEQLQAALQSFEADAVILGEIDGIAPDRAVSIVRAHCTSPLILFAGRSARLTESDFDLVVPALTPPTKWLAEIAGLIERAGKLRAHPDPARPKPVTQDVPLSPNLTAMGKNSRVDLARSKR